MNHAELSDAVAASLGVSKADAKKAVDAVFAVITDAAAKGDEVSVNGFGKFKVKESAAREGRSEEHTSELQSLMRISYAVFCLKKQKTSIHQQHKQRGKTIK